MNSKKRLDQLLVDRGLAASRSRATALILAGEISSGGRKLIKPGQLVEVEAALEVKQPAQYVSRGGDKLASVLDELKLEFRNKIVLDVGASTGGFTDVALQQDASRVYAVDVGTGQLDWKLRNDPRVRVFERTDIRKAQLPESVDIALIDVSFISLKQVLLPVSKHLKKQGLIAALAKPQFEAGKTIADRHRGVIKDEAVRRQILDQLRDWVTEHFAILNEMDSRILGTQGNRERFLLLKTKH